MEAFKDSPRHRIKSDGDYVMQIERQKEGLVMKYMQLIDQDRSCGNEMKRSYLRESRTAELTSNIS